MAEPVIHANAHADADLVPVRMCNELVYCPRLFYLEHVQGIFVESADTVEGSAQHKRAERRGRRVGSRRAKSSDPPDDSTDTTPDADPLPKTLALSSEAWGVRGSIDMVELDDDRVVAVEAKHGRAPSGDDHCWHEHRLPYRAWPADVAQLGLYMALLREIGLPCDEGRILYRASNHRTTIPWSDDLEFFLRDVLTAARTTAALPHPPEPLLDSPKCVGCSLHEVCLPDEHHALHIEATTAADPPEVRRIVPGRDDRAVLHVLSPGTLVRKQGDSLLVCPRTGEEQRLPLKDITHVALFSRSHLTEPCLVHLLLNGITISHHTGAGRMIGYTSPLGTRNIVLRRAQFRAADDPARCLEAARAFAVAKIRNQRTVLKRYRRGLSAFSDPSDAMPEWMGPPDPDTERSIEHAHASTTTALKRMRVSLRQAEQAATVDTLRGHEGDAAAAYFAAFPAILPPPWQADFCGRSRRPPRDRVNALLSFGYALLVRDAVSALGRVGLDPMLGLYHTMIPGRPAAALDLVEPFRAAWVDTAVLRLVSTGGITRDDFHFSGAGVLLSDRGRRSIIRAYERRADELTTHPRFGYRMSYRRLLELEARVLGKWLADEIDTLRPLWTR